MYLSSFITFFSVSLVWLMCLCLCLLEICYMCTWFWVSFLFFYGFQSLWIFSKFWKFCLNFTWIKQKLPIDFVAVVQKLTAKVFMGCWACKLETNWWKFDYMCSHNMRDWANVGWLKRKWSVINKCPKVLFWNFYGTG